MEPVRHSCLIFLKMVRCRHFAWTKFLVSFLIFRFFMFQCVQAVVLPGLTLQSLFYFEMLSTVLSKIQQIPRVDRRVQQLKHSDSFFVFFFRGWGERCREETRVRPLYSPALLWSLFYFGILNIVLSKIPVGAATETL